MRKKYIVRTAYADSYVVEEGECTAENAEEAKKQALSKIDYEVLLWQDVEEVE